MVSLTDTPSEELWRRGELRWKLRPYQVDLYDEVWRFLDGKRDARKMFADCHRRYGKSFVLFLIGVEVGLGKSDIWPKDKRVIRFAAPTMLDLEEIYLPIAEDLFEDCPEDVFPAWNATRGRGHFEFPSTGSLLYLFGVDGKHYRKARGKKCTLGVVDEAGSCEPSCGEGIKHVVNSVFLPQTFSENGRIVVATTPPETPAHDSYALKADAQACGTYLVRTIDDTAKYFGPGLVAEYERESGGRDSTAFQREYLCKWVVDARRAVIPEFTDEKAAQIVKPAPDFVYETPLAAMDVGFEDFTHVLFGYYNFKEARLYVQDETRLRRMRTDQLACAVKEVEGRLWHGKAVTPSRVSDVDLILLHDLASIHGLHFQPTSKDELEAMVNETRLWVQGGRIVIDPKCQHLIRQLHSAIWNKQRTSFERTSTDGHFDAVAALIYMVRNAPTHLNPYPALDPSITQFTHHINYDQYRSEDNKAFGDLFNLKKRRKVA